MHAVPATRVPVMAHYIDSRDVRIMRKQIKNRNVVVYLILIDKLILEKIKASCI